MTKTYNVADYDMHGGPQLVIIVKDNGVHDDCLWVYFVDSDGNHNGLMRPVKRLHVSNFRTAELLA